MVKPKKDFKSAAERFFTHDTQEVQDALNTQDTHVAQDVHDTQHTHDTHDNIKQRKQKHPRINMAFYGDNLEYVESISRIEGVSITRYINDLIQKDQDEKRERLEAAKAALRADK